MKKIFFKMTLTLMVLFLASACEKDPFTPLSPPLASDPTQEVQFREASTEVLIVLIKNLRAQVIQMIFNGQLPGPNAYGIVPQLDNILRKVLKGQITEALGMLNNLIVQLKELLLAGNIPPDIYDELQGDLQDVVDVIHGDAVADPDGNVYETVVMADGKRWMAKNLNVTVPGSYTYENSPTAGEKYGRLYTWVAAQTACPAGYHLPSQGEWLTLLNYYGGVFPEGNKTTYKYLAAPDYGGDGSSGFNALMGGQRLPEGYFFGLGQIGRFWTSTSDFTGEEGYYFGFDYNYTINGYAKTVHPGSIVKTNAISCRCVED